MSIALDTNRLIKPTQRRFNGAWFESDEERIQLLPQTATELTNGKFAGDLSSAILFAEDTLRHVTQRGDFETTFKVRCDLWRMRMFSEKDGLYQLIDMTPDQYRQARALREALPLRAFPRVSTEDRHEDGDMLLVSQAMVTSQRLLLTSDGNTIKSEILNDWLYRYGNEFGTDSKPLVFIQDDIVPQLFMNREDELLYVVFGAAWPANEHAQASTCIEQFQSHCAAMEGALLAKTATIVQQQWHAVRDVDALLAHVQHHYLPEKTRHYERLHPANTPALSE